MKNFVVALKNILMHASTRHNGKNELKRRNEDKQDETLEKREHCKLANMPDGLHEEEQTLLFDELFLEMVHPSSHICTYYLRKLSYSKQQQLYGYKTETLLSYLTTATVLLRTRQVHKALQKQNA